MARVALVLFAVASLISGGLLVPVPKSDPGYKLPTKVVPSAYVLDLTVKEDAFTTNKFSGSVAITFKVTETTKDIVLHSRGLTDLAAALTVKKDGKTIETNAPSSGNYDFLTISSKTEDLVVNTDYVLTIKYNGVFANDDMHGFYKSSYKTSNSVEYLAVTQFEQDSAREAFPCFDEPSFKATFEVTIHYPSGYNALSNTQRGTESDDDDGLKKVTFAKTPKMSTYLVAFIVSKFKCVAGDKANKGVTTEVCSREAAQADTAIPKALAKLVLNKMRDYTGIDFGDFGEDTKMTKMTEVAIPDFSPGAMENWGVVTYRERDILWRDAESSNKYKQGVVLTISHEFSHQWFGDLVTLGWWSDVFLNEGFATYFEYHVPAQLPDYTSWRLEEQFVVDEVQTALESDASITSVALHSDVYSPDETDSKFDNIGYNKGGSVLRMLHHLLTLDKFKAGLKDYVSSHKYGNTVPADVWTSLNKQLKADQLPTDKDLSAVMDNWTNKAGFPLLTVKANKNNVIISQKRFLTSGTDETKWYVPISYTLSSTVETAGTAVSNWLTPDADLEIPDLLKDNDWIILNNQQSGYYRVDYDDTLWNKITTALGKAEFSKIKPVTRSQIVDDLLNLAKINARKYGDVLKKINFLTNDVDYIPWASAFRGFENLFKRTADATVRKELTDHLTKLMEKLYKSVPFETVKPDDHIYTLNQVQALTWACKLNNNDCVKKANDAFAAYRDKDTVPDKNLKSIVYCNGLRNSADSKKDYDFLWGKFGATDLATEQITILNALGCTKGADQLNEFLGNIIKVDSNIRTQDAQAAYAAAYSSNPENVDIVLDHVIAKYKEIKTYFTNTKILNSVITALGDRITTQKQIDKLNTFAATDGLDADVKTTAEKASKDAKDNLAWSTAFNKQIRDYFKKSGGGAGTVAIQYSALFGTALLVMFQLF